MKVYKNFGERHHSARLTAPVVQAMRSLYNDWGVPIKAISIFAEVSYPTVWDAVKYTTWKHVRDEEFSINEALRIIRGISVDNPTKET